MGNITPLLRMSGISKSFAGTLALSNVQFEVNPGEVHILAGENGAGKSTLIKILCGVHTTYDGKIEFKGRQVRFSSPQNAAANGIAAIHQELSLVPSMSVSDNIFLGREKVNSIGFLNKSKHLEDGRKILESLGVNINLSRPVEEFSLSICQMIEIAKALSIESELIIMDEPTSALSEVEVERLFKTIEKLKQRGCSIIYISHKMEEIYRIADRITVLRDGQYIGTEKASNLLRKDLIKWMVGREINEHFPERETKPGEICFDVKNFSLSSKIDKRKIVDNVSFHVKKGEILGIGGLQGSGSSELLNGLFGTYGRVHSGIITLQGKPYTVRSPRYAINHGIALLTNDRKTTGLVLGMNLMANITMATIPEYSPGGWMQFGREKECAKKRQSEFNIKAANLAMEAAELSGGNQQKLVLAKWIESAPRVLLLDEPTRGVDVGAKHEVYELMERWTKRGCAIILITSEMPELLALSDRIIVMHRGSITAEFEKGKGTQEDILQAAMGSDLETA